MTHNKTILLKQKFKEELTRYIINKIRFNYSTIFLCILITNILTTSHTTITITATLAFTALALAIKTKHKQLGIITLLLLTIGLFTHFRAQEAWKTPLLTQKNTSLTITLQDPPLKNTQKKTYRYTAKLLDTSQTILIKHPIHLKTPHYKDIAKITGSFQAPTPPRNPGGFDYPKYLKLKGLQGVFKVSSYTTLAKQQKNPLKQLAHKIKKKVLLINTSTLKYPYSDLYTGLVFGEHGTFLPEEWQTQFQNTGLTHLLVVSGSQVALLIGILLTLITPLPIPKLIKWGLVIIISTLFYLITGGGSSIFRASLMCIISTGILLSHRKVAIKNILSITAITMLLINPLSLYDIGAQLSFVATLSLIYGAKTLEKKLPNNWPQWIKSTLSISLAPFLWTTPLLWLHFNTISPISLLSNLVVITWIEALVVIGFFSTLIGFIYLPLSQIINNTSLLIMKSLTLLVELFSTIPYGNISITTPHPSIIALAYIGLITGPSFIDQIKQTHYYTNNKFRILNSLKIITIIITIITTIITKSSQNITLTVTLLDVGQGDAILIETPNKKTILIDSGNIKKDRKTGRLIQDAGKHTILPVLRKKGINKIDLFILTHFDQDHIGGLFSLIQAIPIGALIDNGHLREKFPQYLDLIQKKNILLIHHPSKSKLQLNKHLSLTFLYPLPTHTHHPTSDNHNSIVTKLTYKHISILFTGDLEAQGEYQLITHYPPQLLDSDVLKVGHHGSSTSSTPEFLNIITPKIAIISAGRYNRYGHPHTNVLTQLTEAGSTIYRTDQSGAIILQTNGHQIKITPMLPPYSQPALHTP